MRDLIFSNNSGTLRVVFRTDLIKGNSGPFTVMQRTGLDDFDLTNIHAERVLTAFHQLPYNVGAFIDFANQYGLDLTSIESDGSDSQVLVNLGSGS